MSTKIISYFLQLADNLLLAM